MVLIGLIGAKLWDGLAGGEVVGFVEGWVLSALSKDEINND